MGRQARIPAARFWEKVERTETCWLWKGTRGPRGEGQFFLGSRRTRRTSIPAARMAYTIQYGEVPADHIVQQRCGTGLCVRPDHLVLVPRSPRQTYRCACCERSFQSCLPRLFCSRACYAAAQGTLAERFWRYVEKTATCWHWRGATVPNGYGVIQASGGKRRLYAHRVAWELHHGPIPDGMFVLHDCPGGDCKDCVNPAHLHLGTHVENMADGRTKGQFPRGTDSPAHQHPERLLRGDAHPARTRPETRPRGEASGTAKLTEPQILELRQLYDSGAVTNFRALAARFSISDVQAANVARRKSWQHLP